MKRPRPDLIGIDFAQIVKAGAAEMVRQGEESLLKSERDRKHRYETPEELAVLVFQVRGDPPMWRMETLSDVCGAGIVKVFDPNPAFLAAEMRMKLTGVFEVYGVCNSSADARQKAAKLVIREMGTARLKDSQRSEGD